MNFLTVEVVGYHSRETTNHIETSGELDQTEPGTYWVYKEGNPLNPMFHITETKLLQLMVCLLSLWTWTWNQCQVIKLRILVGAKLWSREGVGTHVFLSGGNFHPARAFYLATMSIFMLLVESLLGRRISAMGGMWGRS